MVRRDNRTQTQGHTCPEEKPSEVPKQPSQPIICVHRVLVFRQGFPQWITVVITLIFTSYSFGNKQSLGCLRMCSGKSFLGSSHCFWRLSRWSALAHVSAGDRWSHTCEASALRTWLPKLQPRSPQSLQAELTPPCRLLSAMPTDEMSKPRPPERCAASCSWRPLTPLTRLVQPRRITSIYSALEWGSEFPEIRRKSKSLR